MIKSNLLALALAVGVLSVANGVEAATYEVCLRIPVDVSDETGQPGELGTDGNWIARGIRIQSVRAPNGSLVAGFPRYATASTGCFSFTSSQSGTFEIGIQPRGELAGSNTVDVRNSAGATYTYIASFDLQAGAHAYIWPYERVMPRVYAIYAYAIQSGFRGSYSGIALSIWLDRDSPCNTGCNNACSVGSASHIAICNGAVSQRFLMAHEYGHANLRQTTFAYNTDCSYQAPGAASTGHEMRGLEHSSCAAMEGWANFVSAAVWNDRTGDEADPVGWLRYWGDSNGLVPVEGETGGCWSSNNDNDGDYRRAFADVCNGTSAGGNWDYDAACANGECIGRGTELDWMRMWWDYSTDDDVVGGPQTAAQMQALVASAGNWTRSTTWQVIDAAASGTIGTRLQVVADWNGTSE